MKSTVGGILKEIRIKHGLTLRTFCLERKLDAIRYSLIERDELKPNIFELNEYLDLITKIPEIDLELGKPKKEGRDE